MRASVLMAAILAVAATATAAAGQRSTRSQVEDAVTEPLRDARIVDEQIPEALQLAASAPYSMQGTRSCATISAEIGRLNAALGADADAAGADAPGEGADLAATAVRTATGALIPGRGIIRAVTGADRQQARIEAAVNAGMMRRSFLKGIGAQRGCSPPAAPTARARGMAQSLPSGEAD